MKKFDFLQPKINIQLNIPEKQRDIDGEIDWKIIDQLHNAVRNFTKNSMESKKIMFTLLGIFIAATLQVKALSDIVKWLPLIIIIVLLFWAFDAYTYYFQEKLRENMDKRFKSLRERYGGTNKEDNYTLDDWRKSGYKRLLRCIFNLSVLFYPVIILIVLTFWFLIKKNYIS